MASFASRIIRWQSIHGRHDLPWQGTRDPYRIWLSEVMLQQTQVATVIPYYARFLARFPTVADLARATEGEVLALWSGLGYYARGRNVLRAAQQVMERGGEFPRTFEALLELPGVGRSTAAAIAAFASGERRAILDANVRRVLARHAGAGGDLWPLAEARTPRAAIAAYHQGMMDLGAGVCTARDPACGSCPVRGDCVARREGRVHELPERRRAGPKPRRETCMLLCVDRGEVLLEKRVSKGLWGGLWSLPECARNEVPRSAKPLPPFTHAFTHFTLRVEPWLVGRLPASRLAAAAGTTWLALADLEGAALPSPIRALLRRAASAREGSDAAPRGASPRRSARAASAARRS